MAEEDVAAASAAEAKETDKKAAKEAAAVPDETKGRKKGLLARVWSGIFRVRGEDYEKRLQYLSEEEAAVHARMKRRTQWWGKMTGNFILSSVVAEVAAVIYAIMSTRSLVLSWQMRTLRVLPMFALPGLSFSVYMVLGSFIKMRERKDQKTLEGLRAERQAKIDELKEKTNYYTTQQLIQRYDLDPAAKAAAATILASKLGADSGLKMSFEDESKRVSMPLSKQNDIEPVPSDGLRNRKKANAKSHSSGSVFQQSGNDETTREISPGQQEAACQGQRYVEHYKGPDANEVGWVARLAAMLVGEDPSESYALICGNCRVHNGLARKEDFPHITYYCPHCHALNGQKRSQGQVPRSHHLSGNVSQPASGNGGIARTGSGTSSIISEGEAKPVAAAVQEQPGEGEGDHGEHHSQSS